MSKKQIPARLLILILPVSLAAVLALWTLAATYPLALSSTLVMLAVAQVVSELFPVRLPSGATISVSYPLDVAALVLIGPTAAVANAALGSIAQDIRARKPALKLLYNLAQVVLSTALAGWAFMMLGAGFDIHPPLDGLLGTSHYPAILLPAATFSIVVFLLNTTLVSAAVAMSEGVPFTRVWRSSSAWQGSTQLALALLGLALAQAVVLEQWLGLLLFVVPLVVSRGVFQGYVHLREAYADTVRGLVAAIEAKDPYTRGHSERVAQYAVATAEAMRLPDVHVQLLELAALLHDLGKVGIGRSILTKRGRLTHIEMDIIQRHPGIAADIIRSVSFLQDAVPSIIHHHERYDGKGYQEGLAGENIPLGARILAVADSYDAMTSERPYKRVLSHHDAVLELERGSGSQFDSHVVTTFVTAVAQSLVVQEAAGRSLEGESLELR